MPRNSDGNEPTAAEVDAFHQNADTDTSKRAKHHTLGPRSNQAAAGDHVHNGNDSPKLPWSSIDQSTLPPAVFTDTGWTTIPLSSGVAIQDTPQTVQVIRLGREVYWRGAFKSTTSFAANSTYQIVDDGAIPTQFLPDPVLAGTPYIFLSASAAPASDAQIRVTAGGGLQLRTPATAGAYYTTASIQYPGAL